MDVFTNSATATRCSVLSDSCVDRNPQRLPREGDCGTGACSAASKLSLSALEVVGYQPLWDRNAATVVTLLGWWSEYGSTIKRLEPLSELQFFNSWINAYRSLLLPSAVF